LLAAFLMSDSKTGSAPVIGLPLWTWMTWKVLKSFTGFDLGIAGHPVEKSQRSQYVVSPGVS
jgi:hypothetical protein